MKSLTTQLFSLALAGLLAFGFSTAQAQPRIGGNVTYNVVGNQVTATVSLQAVNGPDYNLGPSTLQFTYDPAIVDYSAASVCGTDYTYLDNRWGDTDCVGTDDSGYTSTVTRPAANKVSLNIFIFGGGTPVTPVLQPAVELVFTIVPPVAPPRFPNFTWDSCEHSPSDFSFTINDCTAMQNNALPVELTSFAAQAGQRSATLSWETASETDNAGFHVEYARTGQDFQEAGFVDGNGTTADAQQYSYTVSDLVPGSYQFRLKQVDFDGAFEYSQTVQATVSVVGKFQLDNAYPNPFNPQTTLNFAVATTQNVQMQLFDATGRLVMTLYEGITPENETQTVRVDGSTLTSGMYIARLVGENFATTQKLLLVK